MISRLTFSVVAIFWVVMNVLLWRAEYGAQSGSIIVPVDLVWRKILTAPDASSLSIYQNDERTGFCEFSTSVEQEMAQLDEDRPPPEGLVARAGYSAHLSGNLGLGSFTNRVKFDGRVQFNSHRDLRELILKVTFRQGVLEIHASATNQNVHLKFVSDGAALERNFTFADLQDPNRLVRALAGDLGGGAFENLDLPVLPKSSALAQNIHWTATRDRLMVGREPVPAYRLETSVLNHPVIIYASTLGEILRVELPGNLTATLDEWRKS